MKFPLIGMLFFSCLAGGLFAASDWQEPQRFSFGGIPLVLAVEPVCGRAQLFLSFPDHRLCLSEGLEGDHICPAFHPRQERLLVSWVIYGPDAPALAIWSWPGNERYVIPLSGFTFVGAPQPLFSGPDPVGLSFLGRRGHGDGLFVIELASRRLLSVLEGASSVRAFGVVEEEGAWVLEARSRRETTRYRLDSRLESAEEVGHSPRVQKSLPRPVAAADPCQSANTFIAFGDSITAGKMRMNNLVGEMHPELAYPAVLARKVQSTYGSTTFVNEGVSGISIYQGIDLVPEVLQRTEAAYFLLMLGTNDCMSNLFSIEAVLEDLEAVIDPALAANLKVILSTVPPRKDWWGGLAYVLGNIAALNDGIREMVARLKSDGEEISLADTQQAFMDYFPPDGWKVLLEDTGGNHPSPLGQEVIADQFAPPFLAFAPRTPGTISVVADAPSCKGVEWEKCCESDFSHYRVDFGFSEKKLSWSAEVEENAFTFILPPPLSTIYFQLRGVDKSGNSSTPSAVFRVEGR